MEKVRICIMKLTKLELTNFRGIKYLEFPFDGKSTILYGENGVGKSSALNAIDILFSRLIWKITDYRPSLSLVDTDIMFGTSDTRINGTFLFDDGKEVEYFRQIQKKTGRRTHAANNLNDFAEHFVNSYLSETAEATSMPVFVNYGVNRSVLDIPLRISKKHSFGKQAAFENAIQSKIDFRVFFEWFRNQEDLENEEKIKRRDLTYCDRSLSAVRTAAIAMLEGFHDLKVSRSPLRMTVKKGSETLRIEQLSDGEKCTIALFGDLARRLSLANPTSDDPLCGGGIVLIDEVDLHMHPAWQRKVMQQLKTTFPNIQFIITTHSPQILGEGDADCNIFKLYRDEQNNVSFSKINAGYFDSNLVLADLMDAPHVNPKVLALEEQFSKHLRDDEFDLAREVLKMLNIITKGTDPFITTARLLLKKKELAKQEK